MQIVRTFRGQKGDWDIGRGANELCKLGLVCLL